MKRWIALLLFTLSLTGCGKKGTADDAAWREKCFFWSDLYAAIEVKKTPLPDSDLQIAYDGELYTLYDENGERNYRYLISCPKQDKTGYTERLILSNDPKMTVEDITGPEDGVVLLEEKIPLLQTPNFGKIPEVIPVLSAAEADADSPRIVYGKDCFYKVYFKGEGWTVARLDYQGEELCRVEGLPGFVELWELDNGGFLIDVEDYSGRYYALECYDESGTLSWTYRFREGELTNAQDIVQHDGKLYYFGTVHTEGNATDLLTCVFSEDGLLLNEATFGGSDFDGVDYIEKTDDGFVLYGDTQGSDGDFPFSPDGYAWGFQAKLSFELELLSAQETESNDIAIISRIGYLNGEPIYVSGEDDFVPMPELPKHILSAEGVFSYADGYVVRNSRDLGTTALLESPSWRSYTPHYRERIYTGYSAKGEMLWRYAEIIIL